jgi:hypothetical protein
MNGLHWSMPKVPIGDWSPYTTINRHCGHGHPTRHYNGSSVATAQRCSSLLCLIVVTGVLTSFARHRHRPSHRCRHRSPSRWCHHRRSGVAERIPPQKWPLWQNHIREEFVARINLSDYRRSENTINTHKYNTLYWSSSRSYYNLSSRINYTEEVWSQNHASKNKSEFAEVISLNSQNILFALKENVIHRHSKDENPSTESNPHRFGLFTDNPHRHRRQEKTVHHLHTKDSKNKAWATTLSKTYLRWSKDHL